ncbi:MAG: nucleotide exchange factor GrpE [Lachnospiraceae bacterium]|nr:nucleotide exchange factor GrpE [Lachnospiraceae bacterium]
MADQKVNIEIEGKQEEEQEIKIPEQETAETENVKEQEAEFETEDAEAEESSQETEDASEDSEETEEDLESEGDEKKGFFKKKEKKSKQEEKIAELTDRVQRQMAEFDNFRKRTEKEKTQMFEVGAKSVIEKILPVVDNFERGLSAVPEEGKEDPFVQGMDKIYKQLMTELENLEVRPIKAVGEEFNPEFHNAVMQVESEEFESGVVAQELQRGYMYRESVVRHSMVAVVQ